LKGDARFDVYSGLVGFVFSAIMVSLNSHFDHSLSKLL